MNVSPSGAIFGALLMLLICRFLFGGEVRSHQSTKACKRYKAEVAFWRRWLLLDAPKYVRDKYSKLERKVIKGTFIARVMRGMPSKVRPMTPFAAICLTISWFTGDAGWMKVIRY